MARAEVYVWAGVYVYVDGCATDILIWHGLDWYELDGTGSDWRG